MIKFAKIIIVMILSAPISISELSKISAEYFGDMVKAVVDVDKKKIAVSAELHSDLESVLLEEGSLQESLWGINLYPEDFDSEDFIEYDSLINIRAWQGNRSRYVEDETVRQRIEAIVKSYIAQ